MILVTGGTGLVGSHLLFKLVKENEKVRAIYRQKHKLDIVKRVFSFYDENVSELFNRIEWIKADVTDIPSLTEAFKDTTYVYHCAAFVSFEPDKYFSLRKTNIEGTANIVNLCLSNKINKLCYVSSVATLGKNENGGPITEDTHWNNDADNNVYAITKYGAEMEVWRGSQEGLNVVIVNPGVILGPGIWTHGSGSIIKRVNKGEPFYTCGSTGFVDVNDVVEAMISLMKSDVKTQRFVLVAENWAYKNLLQSIASLINVKPPQKEALKWQLQIAWRMDWLMSKLTGKRRRLTKQLSRTLVTETKYSSDRYLEVFNKKFIPIEKSLKFTTQAFLDR
ncbi:NAD-dependent epimerase/dehydratase family protein [Mangrovimonas aestuarii]|uniref:NAD-dependent epimerase/dehydratase family protein n=1 Tax=Mangrovimonas aestuarii TaxID=3018443 RepID=UPI002379350A|nr:NAD-dependent epimerase/dehydratase family protein [Mangrovimonas aestuarii]